MPDTQRFDQTSDSTLAKLLEVDSELAVQEADLLSQLADVQEKRRSLKTVVSLFTTADTPATAALEQPAQTLPAETGRESETVDFDLAGPTLETSRVTIATKLQTEADPEPQSHRANQKSASSTNGNKTKRVTRPIKVAKNASGWQQYLRAEFSQISLPSAVFLVLQREAEQVFDIPAVMKTIFEDELPAEAESKARRQVTNILSNGARKNKWYRGHLGYYSMSKAAAKTKAS